MTVGERTRAFAGTLVLCVSLLAVAGSPLAGFTQPKPSTKLAPTPSPLPSAIPYPAYGTPAPDVARLRPVAGVPTTITLQQAVDIAVMRSPSFAIARAQYLAIRAKYTAEQSALFPNISAQGNVTRNYTGAANTGPTPAPTASPLGTNFGGLSTTFSASVNVQQLIFDGGRVIAAIKSAKFGDLAGQQTLLRELQTLQDTVAIDYFNVLQGNATVDSDAQLVREFQVTEDSVNAEIRAGTAAQSDLSTAQYQTAKARGQLVTAQGAAISAQSTFAATLGLDADTQVQPQQVNAAAPFPPTASYSKALQGALAQRPDYLAAQYTVKSDEQNLRFAKLARFPSITASASDGVNRIVPEQNRFSHAGSLGAQISIPIYDQGLTNYNVAAASSQLDQSNATLTQTRLGVQSDVRSGLAGLISARANFAQAQLERSSAQISLNAAQAKYRVGAATIIDIVTAEANLSQAQTDYVIALYGTRTAEETYYFALGISDLSL
jgi:outer membrane protein